MLKSFLVLIGLASVAHAHCYKHPNEARCRLFKRCSWGDLGCRSQKNLARPHSSILNYFKKD